MNAVEELRQSGFDIWLEGDKVRYKQRTKNPDQIKVSAILAKLKTHREEVVEYLLDTLLTKKYEARLNDISSRYCRGGLDWLKKNGPEHYSIIENAWDELNETWNRCIDGQAKVSDFEQVLDNWHKAQLTGIKLFKTNQTRI
jgi:hypothetical protein